MEGLTPTVIVAIAGLVTTFAASLAGLYMHSRLASKQREFESDQFKRAQRAALRNGWIPTIQQQVRAFASKSMDIDQGWKSIMSEVNLALTTEDIDEFKQHLDKFVELTGTFSEIARGLTDGLEALNAEVSSIPDPKTRNLAFAITDSVNADEISDRIDEIRSLMKKRAAGETVRPIVEIDFFDISTFRAKTQALGAHLERLFEGEELSD